jgi:hypothetical protein
MIQQSRKTVASLLPPNPNIPPAMSGIIPNLSETEKQ